MSGDHDIATLERECATAMLHGDEKACAAVLSDEFTMIEIIEDQPVQVVLKDDWLKRIKVHASDSMTVDDVAVSFHGDVAIATVKLTHSGTLTSHQFAITDVWRKKQTWRLVERHQSRALSKP